MAWQITAVGTPAQLVAAVNALTPASSAETASLARAQTALNAEINSYASNVTLNLVASGAYNVDGDRICMTVQPCFNLGNAAVSFPMPP